MKPSETRKLIRNSKNSNVTHIGSRTSILGVEKNVSIKDKHRIKHVLTTGANGTGKTKELLHVALQDTQKGRGLVIINPKGKLIDEYLAKIPENRYDDLIYVNPSEQPITGINVLETYIGATGSLAAKTNQTELIVSNLIQLFKRRTDNWGARFGRVLATLLRAGIDANIEHQSGYTLFDIKHCATDDDKLKDLIDDTEDPELRSQLVNIKNNLSDRELEPLVRRLNDFTENKTVRHVINREKSDIDFQEVLSHQKILLIDAREGEVGTTVTELLTSIVITKLWAAAQARYYQNNDVYDPFFLFIDELQTFPSEGTHFAEILSKAREYGLGCWFATQYLSQLPRAMRDAASNNCRTKLVFDPSGSEDLPKLKRMLRGTDQRQMTALGDYRAIVQSPGTHRRQTATIVDTYPPWETDNVDIGQLKQAATSATAPDSILEDLVVGTSGNAGGRRHTELLSMAKSELAERGLRVKDLHQEVGDDKPDAYVYLPDGSVAHLEVEYHTLSKPAKTLTNLQRAHERDRECIFVVEEGHVKKLVNILSDPVNRQGRQHEDDKGPFSYYIDEGGEPFTDVEWVENSDYRILEVSEDGLTLNNPSDEVSAEDSQYDTTETQNSENRFEDLREIDQTVLSCIKKGKHDVQQITSTTGLPNHKVNYSFRKLAELGLITVEKPDEPVERIIDGQKRVFQVKVAELTPKAEAGFESGGSIETLNQ